MPLSPKCPVSSFPSPNFSLNAFASDLMATARGPVRWGWGLLGVGSVTISSPERRLYSDVKDKMGVRRTKNGSKSNNATDGRMRTVEINPLRF